MIVTIRQFIWPPERRLGRKTRWMFALFLSFHGKATETWALRARGTDRRTNGPGVQTISGDGGGGGGVKDEEEENRGDEMGKKNKNNKRLRVRATTIRVQKAVVQITRIVRRTTGVRRIIINLWTEMGRATSRRWPSTYLRAITPKRLGRGQ